jgi:Flp pilus assembly protein TadD
VVNLEPDEPRVWAKLGHSLREAGKIVEAEIAYRKALEFDVDDSDTRAALAGILAMQGKSIEPYRLASIKS